MTANGWFQIAVFFALVLAATKPLGIFMARVFDREGLSWTRSCVRWSDCCTA